MSDPNGLSNALTMLRDMQINEEEQADFEVEFFGDILARNSQNVHVLRRLVELLSRRREYETVLPLYHQLIRQRPDDCIARYNLACTLSMLGRIDAAAAALTDAMNAGYCDLAHLVSDPDLNPMRNHPTYVQIVRNDDGLTVS